MGQPDEHKNIKTKKKITEVPTIFIKLSQTSLSRNVYMPSKQQIYNRHAFFMDVFQEKGVAADERMEQQSTADGEGKHYDYSRYQMDDLTASYEARMLELLHKEQLEEQSIVRFFTSV